MKWTKELPTVPGYYVVRRLGNEDPENLVEVTIGNKENILCKGLRFIHDDTFIEIPPEPIFEWLSLNDIEE